MTSNSASEIAKEVTVSGDESSRVEEVAPSGILDNPKLLSAFHVGLQLLLASLAVSIVATEALAGVLCILWIVLMLRGVRYRRTSLDIPILVFVFARLLSILFSEYPSMSYVSVTRELIYYASFFFTAFYLQNVSKERVASLMKVLFLSSAGVTLIAIGLYLTGSTFKVNGLSGGGMLSTQLTFLILVALIAKNNTRIFPSRAMFRAVLFLFALGLALSMTRGDWIATVVGVIIYGFAFNRKLLFGTISFAIVLILLLPSVRHRVTTLENPLENTSDRITLWKDAAGLAGVHPVLGFGPETFHAVFRDVGRLGDKRVGAWHNDVIQLYMESGAVGVGAFCFMTGSFFFISLQLKKRARHLEGEIDAGWMGILLLTAYLISGLFTMPTVSITNGLLFRFFVSVVAVEYQRLIAHTEVP